MNDLVFLRAIALVASYAVCAVVIWQCRRKLDRGARLALDFTLALYFVTFHAGSSWLFVFQGAGIDRYFAGAMPYPRVAYGALVLLSSLPLVVVPLAAVLVSRLLPLRAPAAYGTARPITTLAVWLGVGVALTLVLGRTGALIITLTQNAAYDLGETSGAVEIYARRQELFDSISSIEAGLLYGTLPACAALLLFQGGRRARWNRAAGLALAVGAVVVNMGLFQIGPVLAFGLMCLFCLLVRHRERINARHVLVLCLSGMLLLGSYLSLKTTERDQPLGVALQLALRMPIALPYLFEMADAAPALVERTDSLPHELGEYMFPEFSGAERFVAMPQPSFVGAFFRFGTLAAIATLAVVGAVIAIGGRWLDHSLRGRRKQVPVVAIVLGPALYYMFQIDLVDVLLSSYGVLYVAMPVVAVLVVNSFVQLALPGAPDATRDPELASPR